MKTLCLKVHVFLDCPDINLRKNFKIVEVPEGMKTEINFKIVMLGHDCVGKSCFCFRLMNGSFNTNIGATLGVDLCSKYFEINNHQITVKIWDTAGQERYRAITPSYLRNSHGIIFMSDLSSKKPIDPVLDWMRYTENHIEKSAQLMIIGSKKDLDPNRENSIQLMNFAQERNILYYETSALTGENISQSISDFVWFLYFKFYL